MECLLDCTENLHEQFKQFFFVNNGKSGNTLYVTAKFTKGMIQGKVGVRFI